MRNQCYYALERLLEKPAITTRASKRIVPMSRLYGFDYEVEIDEIEVEDTASLRDTDFCFKSRSVDDSTNAKRRGDFAVGTKKFVPRQKKVEAGRKELRADVNICKWTASDTICKEGITCKQDVITEDYGFEITATENENVEITLDQFYDERWRCKEADTPTRQVDDMSNVDKADGTMKYGKGNAKHATTSVNSYPY